MNNKHLERQADNLLDNVNDTICLFIRKIEELESIIEELESIIDILESKIERIENEHEQSLKVAFEKGYEEGVKYTDGLIKDEKFPF